MPLQHPCHMAQYIYLKYINFCYNPSPLHLLPSLTLCHLAFVLHLWDPKGGHTHFCLYLRAIEK